MSLALLGLGTAQPAHAIDQQTMAASAEPCSCATDKQRKLLPALYRRTRVDRRHSVIVNATNGEAKLPLTERMLAFYPPASDEADRGPALSERMRRYPEEALPLAAEACRNALEDADITPDQISQLVVVSCTGFSAPGVDIGLIDTLGLPATVGRTVVGFMGCHGAMNGLRVARALADSLTNPDEHVLMCCVELCTLHFQYGWDPQKVVANALFADGAAAIVGRPLNDLPPGLSDSSTPLLAKLPGVAAHGSRLLPDSRDLMTWIIRDHGFEMTLSPKVPDLIREHLRGWLEPWLAEQGLDISQVQGWAIHPGGPRVISSVEQALDLFAGAGDPSRQVLRDYGNMSSPTVLFILDQLRQANTLRPWVALAFGPGLTIEATLIR
ncbi:MAG: type III polyketide synthase [Planctomycetota bacterium]